MKVKDIMSKSTVSTSPAAPIQEAIALMLEHRFRHIPVIDGAGHVVGILSDRDIRTALGDPREVLTSDREGIEAMTVADVMTEGPAIITDETSIRDLALRLADEDSGRVSALPVLDAEQTLVGMVSYVDVLRAVGEGRI